MRARQGCVKKKMRYGGKRDHGVNKAFMFYNEISYEQKNDKHTYKRSLN